MLNNKDSLPVIQKTNDYNIFMRIGGNRKLNQAHIKRLINSLSQDATCIKYNPILVNEVYEVIDGQHRLEAIKELKLPIYYIMEKGLQLENAQALNSLTKPWSPMDYAKSYAELGNKNYITYINFKSSYHLNHDILMRYLSLDQPITSEMFKDGKFKVSNITKSKNLCECLVDLSEFYKRAFVRSFALAFKTVWENEKYNHERMIMKLKQQPNAIIDRALPEDYIRDLERIYNHSLDGKDRVRFF